MEFGPWIPVDVTRQLDCPPFLAFPFLLPFSISSLLLPNYILALPISIYYCISTAHSVGSRRVIRKASSFSTQWLSPLLILRAGDLRHRCIDLCALSNGIFHLCVSTVYVLKYMSICVYIYIYIQIGVSIYSTWRSSSHFPQLCFLRLSFSLTFPPVHFLVILIDCHTLHTTDTQGLWLRGIQQRFLKGFLVSLSLLENLTVHNLPCSYGF